MRHLVSQCEREARVLVRAPGVNYSARVPSAVPCFRHQSIQYTAPSCLAPTPVNQINADDTSCIPVYIFTPIHISDTPTHTLDTDGIDDALKRLPHTRHCRLIGPTGLPRKPCAPSSRSPSSFVGSSLSSDSFLHSYIPFLRSYGRRSLQRHHQEAMAFWTRFEDSISVKVTYLSRSGHRRILARRPFGNRLPGRNGIP